MPFPVALHYEAPAAPAITRYGEALIDGRIIGQRCTGDCGLVYVPPRDYCPIDVIKLTTDDDVELGDHGTVVNFTVVTPVQYPGQEETEPFARVSVALDGPGGMLQLQDVHRHAGERRARGHAGRGGVAAGVGAQPRRARGRRLEQHQRRDRGLDADRRTRRRRERARREGVLAVVDVAIVGYGQVPSVRSTEITETQMVLDVTQQALGMAGIDRHDIGFTVSGSCDYLAGQAFAFVQTIEAIGAWPPISESHVEMDGAWAMYEGFTRLQEGDIDLVLVYSHGRSSPGKPWQVWPLQLDPYHLAPLGLDPSSLAALQARALLDAGTRHRARLRRDRRPQPWQRGRQRVRAGERHLRRRRPAGRAVRAESAPASRPPADLRRRGRGGARGR